MSGNMATGTIEGGIANWLLGLLTLAAVTGAGIVRKLFTDVRDLQETTRRLTERDTEHTKHVGELFSLTREIREIVVGVQVDVAAIRRNGHGGGE